jgi:hypothetical protein
VASQNPRNYCLEYPAVNGIRYQADGYFSGGNTYAISAAIAGTNDGLLSQGKGYGNFLYTLPVSDGDYVVIPRFAEISWTQVGRRVFDVVMEGTKVIGNLDIVARVGPNKAYDVTKTVHASDGALTISFQPVVDNPKVSAITVQQKGVAP